MSNFSEFTHKYQVSKTLRFELIPQGKTLENLTAYGMVNDDKLRSENYKKLKPVIDKIYKYFIEETLKHVAIDWEPLYKAITAFRKDKTLENNTNLREIQDNCRKSIAGYFEGKVPDNGNKGLKEFNKAQSRLFKELFGKELFSDSLSEQLPGLSLSDEEKGLLKSFDKFTTYFVGFYENRKNVFSAEDIATSIPHRLVQENFPKFIDDCEIYHRIIKHAPELNLKLETAAAATKLFEGVTLDEIFSVNFYNCLLQQEQIDSFNQLLGGIAGEAGRQKVQGLNETLNLAVQQDKKLEEKIKTIPHRFIPLYKQILSDRSTLSFIPDAFLNDQEVLFAVKEYKEKLAANRVIQKVQALLDGLNLADLTHVYINSSKLTDFSQVVFGEWNLCRDSLQNWKVNNADKKLTKNDLKEIEGWLKGDMALAEIQEALADDKLIQKISAKINAIIDELDTTMKEPLPQYLKSAEDKEILKVLLDAVQKFYHTLNWFTVDDDVETDAGFYVTLAEIMLTVEPIIPLYNKVRNFATQKPYSVEKFKLNFSNPTLADGWDENKEQQNCAILFEKEGKYYLGILNTKNKPDFSKIERAGKNGCYRKMTYKQFPDFSKMLPKCTTQLKDVKQHFISEKTDYILNNKNFIKPLTITSVCSTINFF